MTRVRIVNGQRTGRRGYTADLDVDGHLRGRVTRDDRPSGLGYRGSDYRAIIDGRTVATGSTLADLRRDLAEEMRDA